MSDLVKRLREYRNSPRHEQVMDEAADVIERLYSKIHDIDKTMLEGLPDNDRAYK